MSESNKSQKKRKKYTKQKKQHQFNQQLTQGFPDNFFYVKDILKQRVLPNGRVQLFVSWEGWSSKYNSWVYKDTVMPVEEMWQSIYSQRSSKESLSQNICQSKVQNVHYNKYQVQQTLAELNKEQKISHKKKDLRQKQIQRQNKKNSLNIQKQVSGKGQSNNYFQLTIEREKQKEQSQKQREIKSLLSLTRDIKKDIKQIKKKNIYSRKINQNKPTQPFLQLACQGFQKQPLICNYNLVSAIKTGLQKGLNSQKKSLVDRNKQTRLLSQNVGKKQSNIYLSSQQSLNKSEKSGQLGIKIKDIDKKRAKKDIKQAKKRKKANNKTTQQNFLEQQINLQNKKAYVYITTDKNQQIKIQTICQQNKGNKQKLTLHNILNNKNSVKSAADKSKFVLNSEDRNQKYNNNTIYYTDRRINTLIDENVNDSSKYIIKLDDQQQISDSGQLSYISLDNSCNSFRKFYDMKKKPNENTKQKQKTERNETINPKFNPNNLLSSLGVNSLIDSSIYEKNICESTHALNNLNSSIKQVNKLCDQRNLISRENQVSTKANNNSCLTQSMLLQEDSSLVHNMCGVNKVANDLIDISNARSNLIQSSVQINKKCNLYQLQQKRETQKNKISNVEYSHNQTSLLVDSFSTDNRINLTNSLLITPVPLETPSKTINNCSYQQSLLVPSLMGIQAINSNFNNESLLCSDSLADHYIAKGNLTRIQEIQSQIETVSKQHNDTGEPVTINPQSRASSQRSFHPQHREKTDQMQHVLGQQNKFNQQSNKDRLRNQSSQIQSTQRSIDQSYIRHLYIDTANREYTNDKKYNQKQAQGGPDSNKSCPTIIKSTQVKKEIEEIPTGSKQDNEKCIIKQYDSCHSSNTDKVIDQPQSTAFFNNNNISFRLECDHDINDGQHIIQCPDDINNEHIRDYLNELNSGLAQDQGKNSMIHQYIKQLKSIKKQIQRNVICNQYDKNGFNYNCSQKYGANQKSQQSFAGTHTIQVLRNRREHKQRHIKQQQEQSWQLGNSTQHNKSGGQQPIEDANNVIYWQPNLSYANQSSNSSKKIQKKACKYPNTGQQSNKSNKFLTEKGVGLWTPNNVQFCISRFPNAHQNNKEYINSRK